ncbi:MAG: hypothetical protein J6X44_14235 [Thermoguttaceae bacterium]|nr:hypothetical protein [Thermoguttaceae bacterium]
MLFLDASVSSALNAVLLFATGFVLLAFCFYFFLIPKILCWRASKKLRIGDCQSAVESFFKALKISPRDARNWYGYSLALRRAERYDEALEALDNVDRLEPGQTSIFLERVDVLRSQKRLNEALDELSQKIQAGDCPDQVRLMRSAVEIEAQLFEEAESDCNYLIEHGGESVYAEAFNNRGVAKLMLGREADAESDFETSYLLDPRSSVVRAYCSSAWLRRNAPQKTLALCDATIKTDPLCAAAYHFRGLAKQMMNDFAGANDDFQKADELKRELVVSQ